MPSRCVVCRGENEGVHRFPKSEPLKLQWIQAARLGNRKYGRRYYEKKIICSAHFKKSDFIPTARSHRTKDIQLKRLRPNAVPSRFPWTSQEDDDEEFNLVITPVVQTYSRVPPTRFVEEFPDTLFVENETHEDPLALGNECAASFNEYDPKIRILKESVPVYTEINEVPPYCIEITMDSPNQVKESQSTLCEPSSSIDELVLTMKTEYEIGRY